MAILKKRLSGATKKSSPKAPAKKSAAKPSAIAKVSKKAAAPKTKTDKKPVKAKTKPAIKTGAKKIVAKKPATKKPVVKKSTKVQKKAKNLSEQMLDAALKVLDEKQAQEIVVVPLSGRSSLADYMILASGRVGRQIVALSDYLREAFSKLGARNIRVEGQSDANWVLVDAGDVIVHLFLPEVRRYYDLDTLWADKAVRK